LGVYPKKYTSIYRRDICIPIVIAALFIIEKLWNQLQCPITNEWIKKIIYVYVYSTIKKK
jgi:hypothetical protein